MKKQECIPVGCVPATRWRYAWVCFGGGIPKEIKKNQKKNFKKNNSKKTIKKQKNPPKKFGG